MYVYIYVYIYTYICGGHNIGGYITILLVSLVQVSMGEGQEKVARDKNNAAFITGGWLVLQNCHLGIDYMNEVEDDFVKFWKTKCLDLFGL